MFILVLAGLLIWIVPSQLKYANEFLQQEEHHITLLDSEIKTLEATSDSLLLQSSEDEDSNNPSELKGIMESSEGIFLYLMTNLYHFEYLEDEVIKEEYTAYETVSLWTNNLLGYYKRVEKVLVEVNQNI